MRKPSKKTSEALKSPKLGKGTKMPQPNGSFLVAGAGGGPQPGAGRPPDEWRAKLRAFASRDEVMQHVESVLLEGPSHPFFDRALQYATDHGYGRAQQPIEHNIGKDTLEALLARSHQPPPLPQLESGDTDQ